jgi:superfamily II DNA or RNA helicase
MLNLYINNLIRFDSSSISSTLYENLKQRFTYSNPEYYKQKAMGFYVGNIPQKLYTHFIDRNTIAFSRGTISELRNIFNENGIQCKIYDERKEGHKISYRFERNINLYPFQTQAVNDLLIKTQGVLIAPPGAGKTVMAMGIINKLKRSTLIIVHTSELLRQWKESIQEKTNQKTIGQIGAGKYQLENITIGMLQTLTNCNKTKLKEINNFFGIVITDECHHVPANTLFYVLNSSEAKYRYGLTATPRRKDGKEFLLKDTISQHNIEITDRDLEQYDQYVSGDAEFIFDSNFIYDIVMDDEVKADFNMVIDAMISNEGRNLTIVNEIIKDIEEGRLILVLTTRVEHCRNLQALLEERGHSCEAVFGDPEKQHRQAALRRIREGKSRVMVATENLAAEGLDIPQLDTLHIVIPTTNKYKLKQMTGRIRRKLENKKLPLVKDYADIKNDVLKGAAKKRVKIYKDLGLHIRNIFL